MNGNYFRLISLVIWIVGYFILSLMLIKEAWDKENPVRSLSRLILFSLAGAALFLLPSATLQYWTITNTLISAQYRNFVLFCVTFSGWYSFVLACLIIFYKYKKN